MHAQRGSHRDRASAIALLERAGATAETLGMRPLAAAVAAELKLLIHPRGRRTLLSNRELEVAGLVVEGLTNRGIGERFHISERTAENHVKNIMDKLGIDSRAQIAAWYTVQVTKLST
jgi:DNA-binding NarL/FixJ family response regulator